jgi:HYDIN/CFA65/VesB-like, Ig-like domain/Secretion system C-terminal sorting domain/PQQ-like domain
MKRLYAILFFLFSTYTFSQTLIQVVNLPSGNFWNYGYGLVYHNSEYWISSGYSPDGKGVIKSVDENGNQVGTININYPGMHESQGLAFDGINFWYVERKTARCDLFKVSPSGDVLDSITSAQLFGSGNWYMGGAAWDGTGLWISIYYPDVASLYKVDVNSKQVVDTIQTYGIQPTGITVKGDTLFYVMDGFQNDDERIYAVNLTTKDTLFSFHVPALSGSNENPRGLAWDGSYLWLLADVVSGNGKELFKYDLNGNGTPRITVSPTLLNFPQTTVGDTSTADVIINNVGTADLSIDSISFSNPGIFGSSGNTFPVTIQPGNSYTLTVNFYPQDFFEYNETMSVYNNDLVAPVVDVNLHGQGILNGPIIYLTASSHNFGNVWVGNDGNVYWSFGIINQGDQDLTISNLHFNLPEFGFESPSLPFNISPTDTQNVRISFHPSQPGDYIDTLRISSNDPQNPTEYIFVQGTGVHNSYDLGYQFWNYQVPDNPRAGTYQEYKVIGLKPIEDINGDGISDVIIATSNYWLMALDGAGSGTTDTLWTFNTFINNSDAGTIGQANDYGVQDALAIVNDLNGDGHKDVVIGTGGGNEHVYALDGTNGHIIWQYGDDINYNLGDFEAVDGRRDFNGDGVPDILAIADGNELCTGYHKAFLFNGVNGNIIWTYSYPGPCLAFGKTIISVNDITGDGLPDAVIAVGNNGTTDRDVIGLNGVNGQQLWLFPAQNYEPKEMLELNVPGQTPDVIAAEYFTNVYRIDGETGQEVWTYNPGFTGTIQISLINDINGDGIDEVLLADLSSQMQCISGADGSVLWSYPMAYQYGVAQVPDLNNDGVNDVITGDQNGTFYCIEGTGTPLLFSQNFPGDEIYTLNALPSIDGNASYELLAGTYNGKVICFSGGLNAVPVELTSFAASVSGTDVDLVWNVASQLNNKGFSLERKKDNGDYKEIAFVKGDGTTSEQKAYNYKDKNLASGNYTYRIKQIDFDGSVHYSKEVNVDVSIPREYSLSQNFPNPFNPSTTIKYSIVKEGMVLLKVYDVLGKEVKTLVNKIQKPGIYSINFNASNLASGVYIYRINSESFHQSKKMMILK